MSFLTGPAPLPPLLTNPVVTLVGGTQIVLNILAARAVDQLPRPLIDILQDASGGGSVVTGTVEETSPDGTVTVGTQNGTSITVHHPPELPLELGSTVVLRLIPSASAPQALLLAVNGRPVLARIAPPSDAQPPAQAPAIAAAPATRAALPSPTKAAVASSFIAAISLEDEAAIEAALSDDRLAIGTATAKTAPDNGGPAVIAVLIRPAPARLGQVPVASGTRYLVTLRGTDSPASTAPARAPSAIAALSPSAGPRPVAAPPTATAAPPITPDEVETSVTEAPATPASGSARPAAGPTPAPIGQGAEPLPESGPIAAPSILAAAPIPEAEPVPSAPAPPLPIAPDEVEISVTEAPATPASGLIAAPVATIREVEPVPPAPPPAAAPPETAPAEPPSPVAVQSPPAPSPPIGDDAFRVQPITLAGRVAPPRVPGETLVETALGTLALPLSTSLPPGLAVQLRVSAVAPPVAPHPHAVEPAPVVGDAVPATLPPSLIEALTQVLAPIGPGLVAEVRAVLAIEPGNGLAAAIIGFLTGNRAGAPVRVADLPSRKALLEAGRTDLAARLDHARGEIGTVRPQRGPDGWNVTILPFLGAASVRPIRLYRKRHQPTDEDARRKGRPSERFMLEVELKRLGPLQFDGLVRERRFDLVVRSRDPFLPALQQRVAQVFQDGLLITGWHGEIDFARIGAFPLISDAETARHLDLGA